MKSKLYSAVVSKLVMSLGILSVLAVTASGQGSWTALADTPDLVPEHTVYLPLADPPFTEYVYQQVDVGAGATGMAIATCPNNSIVVGGGYAAHPDVAFYYAVCLHNVSSASVTQAHGQVGVSPGTRKQAVATCPAGSIATGGGFHGYYDGSLRVYNSSKADSGEGWQSWADNLSGSTKNLHAYAICLSGSGGTTARILHSTQIPPSSTGYAIPKCGSGALVTGGGFAAQDDLIIYSSSGPYSGDEWQVYVKNTHSYDDRTLFGYAICLSLPEQTEYDVYLPLIANSYVP
jgi:ferredoxin